MEKSDLIVMAGPCSVESEEMLRQCAEVAKRVEADYLRGGAFKPRTKAGEWTGYGEKALLWLRKVADEFELKIVTEIMGEKDIPMFQSYGVDLYQVGARNAQNQELLLGLGQAKVPVLLKNGMNTSLQEWLGSAGKAGKPDSVMLCARGKNNETNIARNGQDITTLVHLVDNTPYQVVFDPSHIAGKRELIYGITMGAIAIGIDGIIVETHPDPMMARTDGRQSITLRQLEHLVIGSHEQRNFYLRQEKLREGFEKSKVPGHIDIYFRLSDINKISPLIRGLETNPYYSTETGILTARIPAGLLGVFRKEGYAIGELVKYAPKEGSSAEAVHIVMPNGIRIKMSPFSRTALDFRGKKPSPWTGERIELAHGFPGQTIRDAYLTVGMGRIPSLLQPYTPLVIYNIVKE